MKDKTVIMVVDDQPQNIELLEAILSPLGYEIVRAANGEEALEKLSGNQIDLILLDVMMPGIDGFEVTRRVRKDNTHRLLPIIMVTALRETEDRVKGIEAGCDDFISKPVDKMELLARVRSLLKVKAYNDLLSNYRKELETEVTGRTGELKRALENLQQDIIERKLAESQREVALDELQKREENFRLSLDDSPLGVRIVTVEGDTIYANRAILDIYGYDSIEELKNTPLRERYTPDSYAEFQLRKEKRLRGDLGPSEYEISIVRKNGEVCQVHVFRKEIFWNGARQFQVIYLDITERRKMEKELLIIKKAVESSSDSIGISDPQGHHFYHNKAFSELFEYTPEELEAAGGGPAIYANNDIAGEVFNAIMDGGSWSGELEMISKSGRKIPFLLRADTIKDESGKIIGLIGLHTDITERKLAEMELRQTLESLRKAVNTTIQVMVSTIEMRDPYTSGHQTRSAHLACAIATEMGLPQEKIDGIQMAGSIHDIGKLSIPAEILSKPTKLTNIEFSLIKEHAQKGYEMLNDVESPWLLAQIVYQHHERMDGSGYPRNLKGEEICMEARILAVADVVEAMASHRPYRSALGIDAALNEIEKNRGTFYDNTVVDACLKLFREKGFKLEGT